VKIDATASSTDDSHHRTAPPATFWGGLFVIVFAEVLLALDVQWRGGVIVPDAPLPEPTGALQHFARFVAVHMTPIAWCGFLSLVEGLLTWQARRRGETAGSCVRRRPWLFTFCYLTSVMVWCYFDVVNFYIMDAWRYHGLSDLLPERWAGYFLAFAAISPGMFLCAQGYQHLGLGRLNTRTGERTALNIVLICTALGALLILPLMALRDDLSFGLPIQAAALLLLGPGAAALIWKRCPFTLAFAVGLGWFPLAILLANPLANFIFWVAPLLLLDPINHLARRPSILNDWRAGRWGRTVALMAGGLTCGLLWEFWNYWAVGKWTYHLAFLGPLENIRYFEMPVVGLLGFIPFGPTCWVMMQTLLIPFDRVTEPLPKPTDVL